MFRLELDENRVPAGGTLRGAATFRPAKDVTPNRIRLEVKWTTQGRGDADGGCVLRGDLDVGPVAAGETLRVPFAAPIPADAVRSFAGKLIALRWEVQGRADLPWAFDETAEAPFAVTHPDVRGSSGDEPADV